MQFEHLIPGRFIDLERFTNTHIPELESIAIDEKIWQNLPFNIKDKAGFDVFVKEFQAKNQTNERVTYVIRDKTTRQVYGGTGFLNIDAINQQLEIGPTWLSPIVWGT